MRAYVLERYGGPERANLREWPKPVPGIDDVLVRVHAAGLNPIDYKIRAGALRVVQRFALPVVLGSELAGTVEACGAAVTRFKSGDRVFARVAKHRLGAFAEYAAVDASFVAAMPSSLDFAHAAAVPLAALTALQGLREQLACGPGQQLLIAGGAGGVGTFAIPLAKRLGAHVTTTASPRGAALVRALGADHVIDYTTESLADYAGRFDAAYDLVGGVGLADLFACVKRGGRVLSVAGPPEPRTAKIDLGLGGLHAALFRFASRRVRAVARLHGVDYRFFFMRPDGAQLAELAALIDAGTLPVTVDRVFDFAEIADAMSYLETGRAKGEVVVRIANA